MILKTLFQVGGLTAVVGLAALKAEMASESIENGLTLALSEKWVVRDVSEELAIQRQGCQVLFEHMIRNKIKRPIWSHQFDHVPFHFFSPKNEQKSNYFIHFFCFFPPISFTRF